MPRENRGHYLERDRRSGIYVIKWYEAGRRRTRSTGTRDRPNADQTLASFLLEVHNPTPDKGDGFLIGAILDTWLDHKSRLSQRETTWKVRALKAKLADLPVSHLRPAHVRDYVRRRKVDGAADGTIAEELSKLSSALRWAKSERMIPEVPEIEHGLKRGVRHRWLTTQEADKLVAACKAHHLRLFILLALATGARTGAILELTWDRVDLERRIIDYGIKPGGKNRAVVPMTSEIHAELTVAREAATCRHVIEYGGRQVTKVSGGLAKVVARAGIPPVSPHDLRRTCAHWLLQRGARMEEVSAILGHRSITTTQKVYARLYPEHLREAVKRLERG